MNTPQRMKRYRSPRLCEAAALSVVFRFIFLHFHTQPSNNVHAMDLPNPI